GCRPEKRSLYLSNRSSRVPSGETTALPIQPLEQGAAQEQKLRLRLGRLELGRDVAELCARVGALNLAELDRGDGAHAELLQRHLDVESGQRHVFALEVDVLEPVGIALICGLEPRQHLGTCILEYQLAVPQGDIRILQSPPAIEAIENTPGCRNPVVQPWRAAGGEPKLGCQIIEGVSCREPDRREPLGASLRLHELRRFARL